MFVAELLPKLARLREEEQGEVAYRHRPSNAGPDRCIRQQVYQASGRAPDRRPNDRMHTVFDDGRWHEELTLDLLAQSAYVPHSQQMRVTMDSWEPHLAGSIDGILTDAQGRDVLLEHKSANHFSFERMKKAEELPEGYLTQCAIYLRGIQRIQPTCTRGVLLVKNKNTGAFLEFLMAYDYVRDTLAIEEMNTSTGECVQVLQDRHRIVESACERFRTIDRYVAEQALPPRPHQPDDWQCGYCRFQPSCWSGYEDEVGKYEAVAQLDGSMAELLAKYRASSDTILEMTKEKERMRLQLIKTLHEHGCRKGMAGEYTASMSISMSEKVQWGDVPKSVMKQLDPYRESQISHRLIVSQPKKKERHAKT